MAAIRTWSPTAASNNQATPDGWPEGMAPSAVNDVGRELMASVRTWYQDAEWIDWGHAPTRVNDTQFTVPTDQTAVYAVSRRVRVVGATTGYGTISASSYGAPNTTVTVTWLSGVTPTSPTTASVSILTATGVALPPSVVLVNTAIGATGFAAPDNGEAADPGYRGAPINSVTGSPYTLVLLDAGKSVKTTSGTGITIPDDAAVAFPDGTVIQLHNRTGGSITVTKTTASGLKWNGFDGSTGARTLPNNSTATIYKSQGDEWLISGPGMT